MLRQEEKAPETGDGANIALMAGMLAIGCAGMFAFGRRKPDNLLK